MIAIFLLGLKVCGVVLIPSHDSRDFIEVILALSQKKEFLVKPTSLRVYFWI
uniref:Uncharacterized protein n=1 Tax=Lepeophtheirus salmonis TaxID=72036 RepID=A0A0K2VJ20_LEPSM